jgi:hypothetical protein
MTIRKIKIDTLLEYADCDELVFVRPIGSILHRICSIPDRYTWNKDQYNQLIHILNTTSVVKRADIYYFHLPTQDKLMDVMEKIALIGIQPYSVDQAHEWGSDKRGFPIPEIYN